MSDSEDVVIPLISFFLIILFVVLTLFLNRAEFEPPTKLPCAPGLCATNIFTGAKRCPSSDKGVIIYDPSIEVCNPPGGCNNPRTPCVYYDITKGSSCPGIDPNYTGICPPGIPPEQCRCVGRLYCPDFASTYFESITVENGGTVGIENPTALVQKTVWYLPLINQPTNSQPLSPGAFGEAGNFTCGVSTLNCSEVWPPTGCEQGEITYSERDELWYCTFPPDNLRCRTPEVAVIEIDGNYTCKEIQGCDQLRNQTSIE